MADILTQLHDCLDQLSIQITASLAYTIHHAPLPGAPPTAASPPPSTQNTTQNTLSNQNPSFTTTQTSLSNQDPPTTQPSTDPLPPSPETFASTQQELASDLITKVNQINSLVDTLPGLENNKDAQEERIKALEVELQAVEGERRGWVERRERALKGLEGVIAGVRRYG